MAQYLRVNVRLEPEVPEAAELFFGSISEIDDKISHHRLILLSLPRFYPSRSSHLQFLARLYSDRYTRSLQREDLDTSILYCTEAVFVASHSDRAWQDTIQAFSLLAFQLIERLTLFKQPCDAQHCTEYFRYLESLELFGVSSSHIKAWLLVAMAFQVELGIGDAVPNIDEMMARFHDLLASDIPQPSLNLAISALVTANDVYSRHSHASKYLEIMIDCLREANRRLNSHDPEVAQQLAHHLCRRFREMYSIDDYDEAMALFDKIITSEHDREFPGPYTASALFFSAMLAGDRAEIYKNLEYLEDAIHRHRKFLRIHSTNDHQRSMATRGLTMLIEDRCHFGIAGEGLPEARSPDPEVTSFAHLVTDLRARSTVDKTDWWAVQEERSKHIWALNTVCCTTDIAEIAEAIEYCQLLLALTPSGNSLTYYPAHSLGKVLFHAFECTNNMEYLNKSIATFRNILTMPNTKWAHFNVLARLHTALSVRFRLSGEEKDFDEMMQLCSMGSTDAYANLPDRLRFSYVWAENARLKGHKTTSTAYETALSLMEDTLLFAPTLETQHLHLVSRRDVYEALPKNIASFKVSRGRLRDAIQALERGRSLIWSEMRGFRTSIGQLPFPSHLADGFVIVNQELETLTTSVSPNIAMNDDDGLEDGEGMGKFGRLVARHRELLTKRNELVSKIQALPGFEGFLRTPSFDNLRSAAVHGPVIIVNHSRWRSDILVVLSDIHPSLITTSDAFYNRAIELRNRLVHARNDHPLESRQYQRALQFVLKSLYELVGQPVIKELQRLKIPEQSRIWWCPTSVFCSLPLHAMGPIPSDDGVPRYFSDLYIPSYTPTLSALIDSRKPSKSPFEKPSVLLVATPDDSLQEAWPEIWSVQHLNTVTRVTSLLGERTKSVSVVLKGLQDHQFVHFICHGNLVPEKPFDASFGLYGGNRLTLLDIVRSRLPTAEFAFLSACHTAELTEGSIADEGLHLAAAVQNCGFRSVVGTMWAMADQDGGDLAKHFYKSMFSSDEPGVPYHERSAKALRDSVRSMRKEKRLPLEQWVNFVHYGA